VALGAEAAITVATVAVAAAMTVARVKVTGSKSSRGDKDDGNRLESLNRH
jgi:hypothetical protein